MPAVLIGSLLSSSAPDRYVRPVITFVISASGLKYVGLDTETLGWTLCAILLAVAIGWLVTRRPWEVQPELTGVGASRQETFPSRPTDVTPRPDLD